MYSIRNAPIPSTGTWPTRALAATGPASTTGTGTGPNAADIARWQDYSLALATLAGVVKATDETIDQYVKDPKAQKIVDASLRSLYAVLYSGGNTINTVIVAYQAGTTPQFTLPPISIPPWNPGDPGQSTFSNLWQALEPTLELAYQKWGSSTEVGAAIYAVITAGDNVVKVLEYYYGT